MTYDVECRIDFETRSDVDIRTRGAGPYFESPHWAALGASYRIGDGPLRDWERGQPCPDDLREHIERGGRIRAFNASFERNCFKQLHLREGWPMPAIDRFWCTAAEAAAMGLPRSLEQVSEALGLEVRKDPRGKALINKFSKPRRPRRGEPPGVYFNEPEDLPEDYAAFVEYRRQDVLTEEAVAARLVPLSTFEHDVYVLSEIINDRGIRIDVESARAAIELAEKARRELDREMCLATGGRVPTTTQVGLLVDWLNEELTGMPPDLLAALAGDDELPVSSAAKADLEEMLAAEDLPERVRRAIEIRLEAAKTSVSKLKSMLARANSDGRVRGSFLYHGASTGRWASMGVNFTNMPRPRKVYEDAKPRPDVLFAAIRTGDPEALRALYPGELGRPLHLISDAIRSFIWAAPGHRLVQADYVGIEGAVAAWFAGEDWKVKAIHEINANPELPDMYRRTAAQILNTTTEVITKKHPMRQAVGKVSELALGYGGGVSAFHSMARLYGVKLDPLYGPIWDNAAEEDREAAVRRYEACLRNGAAKTDALSREAWIACELIKRGWRATNSAIAGSWKLLEDGIREAIENPGVKVQVLKVTYLVAKGFLWCRLPSGRCLAYGNPKLKRQVWVQRLINGVWTPDGTLDIDVAQGLEAAGDVRIDGEAAPRITALGVDSVTKKWRRFDLYGGLALENVVQAIARDILVNGMMKAEAAGYPIIAHVYDEMIAEVPDGFADLAHFEQLICELPPWAEGLPLAAGGFIAKRYKKD